MQAHLDAFQAHDDAMTAQRETQSQLQMQFIEDMRLRLQHISDALDEQQAETSPSVEPCSGDGELPVDLPDLSVEQEIEQQAVEQEIEQQAVEHSIWDFTQHDGKSFHQAWGRFCSWASEYSEDDFLRDTRPWSFYVRLPRPTQVFLQRMSREEFLSYRHEVVVRFLDYLAEQERAGLLDDPSPTHFGNSPCSLLDVGAIPQVHRQTLSDDFSAMSC